MRLPILTAIIFLATGLLLDIYIVRRLKHTGRRRLTGTYLVTAAIMTVNLIAAIALPRNSGSDSTLLAVMWMLYIYLTFYASKLVFCIVSWTGQLPRLWHNTALRHADTSGIVIAVAIFIAMWWGALINRFNIDIEKVDLYYPTLPDGFDGFKIVQLSDLHVGTYGHSTGYVSEIVDSINALNPDIILFTGDIVNRRTDELLPFVETLSRLSAPMGVYSVLGNHDYGDYSDWPSREAKTLNMQQMLQLQKNMGWTLLNNEHATLYHNSDSIQLVGVENWGEPPFSIYGDLDRAYATPSDSIFKILLTHNPMHWLEIVEPDTTKAYHLTLSGHTHAMQLEIGHWSPSKWRYPIYDGLYTASDSARHIYVSRGIGTVGMPARIGATPAITLITLHSK